MRITVYVLTTIMLSAWAADSGQGATHGLIDKKTAAAIGLAHQHAAKSGQIHSAPQSSKPRTANTESIQKPEPEKRATARKEASVNGRPPSELGLKPAVVPSPGSARSLQQAQLQRIQAETQRLGGIPYIRPSPLPAAQPLQLGPGRNGAVMGVAGSFQQHFSRTLIPLGGVVGSGNIGALNGTSFQPRRR